MYFGEEIVGKFSRDVILALGRAYSNALNRKANEINAEDLLVGLYCGLGDVVVQFFETPETLRTVVMEISGRHKRRFGIFRFLVRYRRVVLPSKTGHLI
jgi:hypothetical protein